VANFWARRLVPKSLKAAAQPIGEATAATLSCIYGTLLVTSVLYSLFYFNEWDDKRHSSLPLMCVEFASYRVQAFTCGAGLLALFTSGDPLALGLALSIFKAVADGSVMVVGLTAFTWRAAMMSHKTSPGLFFGALLACNSVYSSICYTDDYRTNRAGGAIIAACFGSLMLAYYTVVWMCLTTSRKVAGTIGAGARRAHQLVRPTPAPSELPEPRGDGSDTQEENDLFENAEETHPHED
jgi:hypothetical protein